MLPCLLPLNLPSRKNSYQSTLILIMPINIPMARNSLLVHVFHIKNQCYHVIGMCLNIAHIVMTSKIFFGQKIQRSLTASGRKLISLRGFARGRRSPHIFLTWMISRNILLQNFLAFVSKHVVVTH